MSLPAQDSSRLLEVRKYAHKVNCFNHSLLKELEMQVWKKTKHVLAIIPGLKYL